MEAKEDKIINNTDGNIIKILQQENARLRQILENEKKVVSI